MRSLAARLHTPDLFWVCYMDARTELDVNNLQYPDVLVAVARRLSEMLELESDFIYSARINLLYREGGVLALFKHCLLPMIKLETPDGRQTVEAGYAALRPLLLKRADASLFDSPATMEYLIQYFGGHPRDLLKLLFYTYQKARGELFDRPAAEAAERKATARP